MTSIISPQNLLQSSRPKARKGTYFIQTWGCQMNVEDTEQMGLFLEGIGYERADALAEAQVILLNTCSVRKKPEDKAFSLLGELEPLKALKKDLIIGVCGCMAQARADEIRRRAPFVDFVLGTGDLGQLAGLVEDAALKKRFQKRTALPERKGNVVDDIPQRQTARVPKLKAYVPIQYGCDKFCTFCIVPTTRGRERSRPTEDILSEVAALVENGLREVTLLGQTVNSYGKNLVEGRVPFSVLLQKLSEIDKLERIRYVSPYPRDFRSDLIETIKNSPKVMEHVHMPLQSGDDEILKEMHRLYSVDSFLKIVSDIRSSVPNVGLSTDIIVGFPGETDEQYENTLNVMKQVRFDGAYMFAYSIRPGTPAGDRKDQVPEGVKKSRLARLIELQNEITREINATYLGRTLEVLVEGPSSKNPQVLQGYSREYKMVHFEGSKERAGRLANVKVTSSQLWGLGGELV